MNRHDPTSIPAASLAAEPASSEPVYRIGAVSRLTGISSVTIRAWERRYNVVKPHRTDSGNRLYSRDDIAKLALIKRLVDAGNGIGTVARLSVEELRGQLAIYESRTVSPPAASDPTIRVALLGDALPTRVARHGTDLKALDVVAVESERQRFQQAIAHLRPEVLVLEYATLHEDTMQDVEALLDIAQARRAVVVYGFSRRQNVQRLDTDRILPMRAPVGLPELRHACLGPGIASGTDTAPAPSAPNVIPTRRYSSADLSRIAAAATSIHCECPHHLVDLINSLVGFEAYSAECLHRSPEDAELHRYLQTCTAQARATIEQALAQVVKADGLDPAVVDKSP